MIYLRTVPFRSAAPYMLLPHHLKVTTWVSEACSSGSSSCDDSFTSASNIKDSGKSSSEETELPMRGVQRRNGKLRDDISDFHDFRDGDIPDFHDDDISD